MKLKRFKEELEGLSDDLDVVIMIDGQLYDIDDIDNTSITLEITAGEEYTPEEE